MTKKIGNIENKFIELVKFRSAYMWSKVDILRRILDTKNPEVVDLLNKLELSAVKMRQDAIDFEDWRKQRGEIPELESVDRQELTLELIDLLVKANDIYDKLDQIDDDNGELLLKRVK